MSRKPESPCVDICTLDESKGICLGCLRTIDEIVVWSQITDERRRRIMEDLPNRRMP